MTIADQLRAAADVLRRDGWTQGHVISPHSGARCAVGALDVAHPARTTQHCDPIVAVLVAALGLSYNRRYQGLELNYVIDWNDDPTNSAANVIAALDFAAVWWEQAQAQTAQAEQR